MKKTTSSKYKFIIFLLINLINLNTAKAAENVIIYAGPVSRTISIKSLEDFSRTNTAKGTLKNILKLANQDKKEVANILNQEFELPIILTSNLINSKIGTVIIKRISKVIYPNKYPEEIISVPAIRSGVIKAIDIGEGRLNLIGFLKAYPNRDIAVNYGALSKIINKAESVSDLVEFFTESPLEKLKSNSEA